MKLPGINYNTGVRSLGRVDITAPIRVAQAQARAVEQVGAVAQSFYEQQAATEANKALLEYSRTYDEWRNVQEPYERKPDGTTGQGVWKNADEYFRKADQNAREVAAENLTSPLARRLFEEKAAQITERNRQEWAATNIKWMKADELTSNLSAIDQAVQARKFDEARAMLNNAAIANILGPQKAMELDQKIAYQEKYHNYSVMVDRIMTPTEANALRKAVKEDGTLRESDRNKIEAAIYSKLTDQALANFHAEVQAVEAEQGLTKAVARGEQIISEVVRTRPEELGGDSKYKEVQINALITALSRYKVEQVKMTAEARRVLDAECYASGSCTASPNFEDGRHDDLWAMQIMGWQPDGGKSGQFVKDENYDETVLLNPDDPRFVQTIQYSAQTGFVPRTAAGILETAMFKGTGEEAVNALAFYYNLHQANPGALYRRTDDRVLEVVSYAQLLGGTPQAFQEAINQYRATEAMGDDERKVYKTLGASKEFNKTFKNKFDTMLGDHFGTDSPWWKFWESSTPPVQESFKLRVKQAAQSYLPMTRGNMEQAMKMAMIALEPSFGPTRINDKLEMTQFPPEKFVNNGNVQDGKTLRPQILEEVRAKYGADYNTKYLRIEPAPNFSPDDPVYMITDHNPDFGGQIAHLGYFKFDYTKTEEYRREAEAQRKAREAERAAAQLERDRLQWEAENPPETRKYTTGRGTRTRKNPYGEPAAPNVAGQVAGEVVGQFAKRPGLFSPWSLLPTLAGEVIKRGMSGEGTSQPETQRRGRNRRRAEAR